MADLPAENPSETKLPHRTAGMKGAAGNVGDSAEDFDLTGRNLGDFHFVRRLGRGGMAEVYLAEQLSLKRSVAIKVLRAEFVKDETHLKRFQQEAKAAGGLNHANIVQVFSIGCHDGLHYISQEFVQGRTLRDYVRKKGPLAVEPALHIMRQVAQALEAASRSGIVHRDIKPENILISRSGVAKVADFGLAQLGDQSEKQNLTQVGITMGTPLYMSPEQVQGQPLDPRSDLYSFGVTCFYMLVGRTPFKGDTALAIAVQHINTAPPDLAKLRPDLPPTLLAIVERLMEKRKDDRYPSASAVVTEVKSLQRKISGNASDEEANSQLASGVRTAIAKSWQLPLATRPSVLKFALVGALIFCASAGVGWATRRPDPFRIPPGASSPIAKYETAQAQFYHAMARGNDEAAWRAVIDYFPNASLETLRAREKIAVIFLKQRRFEEARQLFGQLMSDGGRDASMQAVAIAGEAVLFSLEGNAAMAKARLAEFDSLRRDVGFELHQLVVDTRRRIGA